MSLSRIAATASVALLALAASPVSKAQYGGDYPQSFECSSNDQRTVYCDVDTRGGVRLIRQQSRAACIEGRSWGWDRRGVWVSQGCRAEFETGGFGGRPGYGGPGYGGPGYGGPGYGGGQGRVTCESRNQGVNYCDIESRGGVVLVRQLSRAACIEGRSWGWDRRGVWVSEGCRGEFESRGGGGWGGPGGGWGGPGGNAPRTVRCESSNGNTRYCDIGYARNVELTRQLSRGACIEGRSWGRDRRGLWVANGCRGEFAIW